MISMGYQQDIESKQNQAPPGTLGQSPLQDLHKSYYYYNGSESLEHFHVTLIRNMIQAPWPRTHAVPHSPPFMWKPEATDGGHQPRLSVTHLQVLQVRTLSEKTP